jgi:hypothetical protein
MTMQRDEDGAATFTIDRWRMTDIRDAAGRAGVEPNDLVELAIRRYLDEIGDDQPAATAEQRLFFDWSR